MFFFVKVKTKLASLPIFIFLAINTYSQEKSITIYGKIQSGNKSIADVHVFNLSKNFGTISNDLGEFDLRVSENDTLFISSLEYEKIKVIITKKNIEVAEIYIKLTSAVNQLDEIILRQLTGNLGVDIVSTPKDDFPNHNFELKLGDLNKNIPEDSYSKAKRTNAQATVDPLGPPGGAGIGLPDKRYEKELKLKREIAQKKQFPNDIKSNLGVDYFTNKLNIPVEKINHFLSYCEYQNIVEKYYHNQVLEVIKILNQESKNYNAIKN